MKSAPRILLLHGGLPTRQTAGAVFLKELCQHYPKKNLYCFALLDQKNKAVPNSWLKIPLTPLYYPGRIGGYLLRSHLIRSIINLPLHCCLRDIYGLVFKKKIIQFVKKQKIDLIWAVLNYPMLIYLMSKIVTTSNIPFVVTVWDPPERLVLDHGLSYFNRQILLSDFTKVLTRAKRCGVASEGMRKEYKKTLWNQSNSFNPRN